MALTSSFISLFFKLLSSVWFEVYRGCSSEFFLGGSKPQNFTEQSVHIFTSSICFRNVLLNIILPMNHTTYWISIFFMGTIMFQLKSKAFYFYSFCHTKSIWNIHRCRSADFCPQLLHPGSASTWGTSSNLSSFVRTCSLFRQPSSQTRTIPIWVECQRG